MKLSIIIPTYNRTEFLLRNLEILEEIIEQGEFTNEISIIISDNCSPDDTFQQVTAFKNRNKLRIDLYRQSENIGLKANVLFVLEKATAEYVMFLGDDDYIGYEYLTECMRILRTDPTTTYIVPNYVPVSVDDEIVSESRDPIGPVRKMAAGPKAILKYAWKAHQMSGLIFKTRGLFEEYNRYKVDNLYPYIFFAGMCCLRGSTYQITEFPVRVVQPVKKKDWGYGEDGLINDLFDNYRKLPISTGLRFKSEASLMFIQFWRLTMYSSQGQKAFWKAARSIAFAKNASVWFTLFFPVMLVLIKLRRKFES
ncbi:glycosyltransferase family 2 protein [Dyadobacter crusticola]|uniref:glycosyltransferase family 2 protein n=1 Tax=Dyadobacter crusticola TaxID=292407 RepID=UPI0004E26442|nr:glycosyltransferase family 2 protein [Dyadobacter crusticola]